MTTVAFVLASWRPDAPAGMERAVAGTVTGLTASGHRAVIITADRTAPPRYAAAPVVTLDSLRIPHPCDDDSLRDAITAAETPIRAELTSAFAAHQVEITVYVDSLWGLGRVMPTTDMPRRVLGMHVVGHHTDLAAALPRAHTVIAPSDIVLRRAAACGYDTSRWRVVPNPLLTDQPPAPEPQRHRLRREGPIRVVARLGPEKGVTQLLAAGARPSGYAVEIALAAAGFETSTGGQDQLRGEARRLAPGAGVQIRAGLRWAQVPAWLAAASVCIVPSLAETFGLVALEAMSVGTPVIALDVDHLPALIGDGDGGVIVEQAIGHAGLWRAAEQLLHDPVRYERISRVGYYRARDYRPAHIAGQLLKVVS
ncbi:glycosyltransferase involved in cell wall biosynthesis [Micromonospora sp. Llam0]|uniref:glycosyltransferase family 4 protein n=1 Tax=Micromonospora sp. Llam0 TaxID=2485143 RepID=UPI000FB485FC|nr:glycosyltransferase family 4 protein [Micromonospora sp. Llam0]ROO51258.1 glycosyltransferase involved in cell wall biosynthesis [Micromonospora sp. Llam0]